MRGIGDDASVVRARPFCVTSVDAMVEGVHFRLSHVSATPAQVGRRALAGALSDLAAMGVEKLLGSGSVKRAFNITVGSFTERAKTKLEEAGGKIVVEG